MNTLTTEEFQDLFDEYAQSFGHTFTTFGLVPGMPAFDLASIEMARCLEQERSRPITDQDLGLEHGEGVYDLANNQDSIRPSCWDCVNKHVGSAIVLMQEAEHGYPEHKLLAIGHLAQAEEESLRQMPDVAAALREIRRRYHAGDDIDVTEFYEALGMNVDALPPKAKRQRKIRKVMREFKEGKLKSSSGDPVTDRRQAIAIALSESGLRADAFEAHFDKPCGKSHIADNKKCSPEKLRQLTADLKAGDEGAKRRVAEGKKKAAAKQKLRREVERDRGKKATDIVEKPATPEFDTSAKPLKGLKELKAEAARQSEFVKGKKVAIDYGDGVDREFELTGVTVADTGAWKGLIAEGTMKTIRKNGDTRSSSLRNPQMSRDAYRMAVGLDLDSIQGGKITVRKVPKGQVFATTSSGVVSVDPGKRQTIDLGKQAVDYPIKAPRTDAFPTYRQRLPLPGGAIAGLTHLPGDVRHGRYMKAGYGVALGTYGLGRDGKSLDLYVGDAPESDRVWRILQTTPDGDPDEFKYMVHCRDKAHARKLFIDHAGLERFGAIEPAGWEELRPKKSRGAT